MATVCGRSFSPWVPQATTIRDLEFDADDAVSHTQILRWCQISYSQADNIPGFGYSSMQCAYRIWRRNVAVIHLSESSVTLSTLVSMCYPCICRFWRRFRFLHYIETDPLLMYFTSMALGFKESIESIRTFFWWLRECLRAWNAGRTCHNQSSIPEVSISMSSNSGKDVGRLQSTQVSLLQHLCGQYNCLPCDGSGWNMHVDAGEVVIIRTTWHWWKRVNFRKWRIQSRR